MIILCLVAYFVVVYCLSVILSVVDYFGEKDDVSQIMLQASVFVWPITLPFAALMFAGFLFIRSAINTGRRVREKIKRN